MKSFIVNFDTVRNANASADAVLKGDLIEREPASGDTPIPTLEIRVPGLTEYLSILTNSEVESLTFEHKNNVPALADTIFIYASGAQPK